jgi:hypothetical protein
LPRTRIFFSGSFFPLATPSSMEDHISFFASELLGRSWSLEDDTCVYVEALFVVAAILAAPLQSQEVCFAQFDDSQGIFNC